MKDMLLGNEDEGNDEDFTTCWPRRPRPPEPSGLLTMSQSAGLQENPPPQEVNIYKGNSFPAGYKRYKKDAVDAIDRHRPQTGRASSCIPRASAQAGGVAAIPPDTPCGKVSST